MGLQISIERSIGEICLMWLFVLIMIHHFGRTTGHQVCNLESPFLALVKPPQHQKEKIFLHSHPCQLLPRKERGHNLSVLKYKLSRSTCLGNPVEVALPGDVNVYYMGCRLWLLSSLAGPLKRGLHSGMEEEACPTLPSVNLLRGLSLFVTAQSEPSGRVNTVLFICISRQYRFFGLFFIRDDKIYISILLSDIRTRLEMDLCVCLCFTILPFPGLEW